jgi:hypothetical protein
MENEILTRDGKEYLEHNGHCYEISGYRDGVPVIKAQHVTKEEVNPDGTIKRSVEVIVPCAELFPIPGNNG